MKPFDTRPFFRLSVNCLSPSSMDPKFRRLFIKNHEVNLRRTIWNQARFETEQNVIEPVQFVKNGSDLCPIWLSMQSTVLFMADKNKWKMRWQHNAWKRRIEKNICKINRNLRIWKWAEYDRGHWRVVNPESTVHTPHDTYILCVCAHKRALNRTENYVTLLARYKYRNWNDNLDSQFRSGNIKCAHRMPTSHSTAQRIIWIRANRILHFIRAFTVCRPLPRHRMAMSNENEKHKQTDGLYSLRITKHYALLGCELARKLRRAFNQQMKREWVSEWERRLVLVSPFDSFRLRRAYAMTVSVLYDSSTYVRLARTNGTKKIEESERKEKYMVWQLCTQYTSNLCIAIMALSIFTK